jgi:hypothetical protein
MAGGHPGRSYTDPISSRQLHRAVQQVADVVTIWESQPDRFSDTKPDAKWCRLGDSNT